jgi:ubiquitin C-terminal hydrolase
LEGKEIYLIAYGVHLGDTVGHKAEDYVHYKAYVKTSAGWIEIDDDNVKILSSE